MQIQTIQDITSQKGYKVNNQFFVPYKGNIQYDRDNKDLLQILDWIKDGGIVQAEYTTEQLFEKAKQSKLAEIKAKRDEILNKTESIIFDGKTYKINDNIRRLYQDKYNIGVFPIDWRCIDDITWVSLINTKALQLLNSFIDFCENKNTTIYQKETTFIIALNNAKSPDDINKIIVNY